MAWLAPDCGLLLTVVPKGWSERLLFDCLTVCLSSSTNDMALINSNATSHPQARALQLWAAANRSGQLRVYTNINSATRALQYSMVTPKPGVAACTVLCWLLELR